MNSSLTLSILVLWNTLEAEMDMTQFSYIASFGFGWLSNWFDVRIEKIYVDTDIL